MASSVVIKVKYEDTLRRFNALVDGDQRLDISMEGLRLKICSLFNIPSITCFTLTYRDEDDDLVTLADDEDLQDVVRQGLNPVRITVFLKTEKPTGASSTGNAKPTESPLTNSQQNVNLNVAEVLKSVPEPLRHAFSKISTDLTSRAESTSPILADLLDGLSKMGHSYFIASPSSIAANPSNFAEGCDDPNKNAPCGKVDASIDKGVKLNEGQTSGSAQQSPKTTQGTTTRDTNFNQPLMAPFSHPKGKNAIPEPSSTLPSTDIMDSRLVGLSKEQKEDHEKYVKKSGLCSKGSLKKRAASGKDTYKPSLVADNRRFYLGGTTSTSYFDSNPSGKYPFSGDVIPIIHTLPHEPNFNPAYPFCTIEECFNKVDGMGSIFHKGVRCDGCGVLPITGPRFKSKVKHDYDLCSICFGRMGNALDYSRIDFPLPYRHPWAFRDLYEPCKVRIPPVQPPNMRRLGGKHVRSRFDCRFITDVNVMDGTMMAPLTPFTKIWRMRNNGTLPWHRGLQLVWIGGYQFSASDSVKIEIPVDGVNVGKEIDIAVDFVAPELPGRYISYWRMAEPSGQKFGQRVWVLIQVDASVDLTLHASSGLNLNLPPETTEAFGHQPLDVLEPELNVEAPHLESSTVEQRRKIQIEDLNFPINNDLLVASDVLGPTAANSSAVAAVGTGNGVFPEASGSASAVSYCDVLANHSRESPPSAPSSTLYPIVNLYDGSSASSSTAKSDKSNLEENHGKNHVEETLLKELENMGFKQVDLNKEVLRVNEYDLERSVDELCGVSEWDPILEELKEMGFEDKETNKKLLTKNNGSITRVVMDLIAGEQP